MNFLSGLLLHFGAVRLELAVGPFLDHYHIGFAIIYFCNLEDIRLNDLAAMIS